MNLDRFTELCHSVLDPDFGAFWIQGLKKLSKMFNQHKIILLFTTLQYMINDYIFQLTSFDDNGIIMK